MILVRHGQSAFNVVYSETRVDPGIADPAVTALGQEQARKAGEALARSGQAHHQIVASPYTRTLETAEIIADVLELPVVVEPLVRERAAFACDIGSRRAMLEPRWPTFDFTRLDHDDWWHDHETHGAETLEAVEERCVAFARPLVAGDTWRGTVVVSHWAFILALTGQRVANGTITAFDPTSLVAGCDTP